MPTSPLAGKPAPARVERDYCQYSPDEGDADQLVSFGTSGHRGSLAKGTGDQRPSAVKRKPASKYEIPL